MGNLFYRGVAPAEIASMDYNELRYWNRWHDVFVDAEKRALKKAEGK